MQSTDIRPQHARPVQPATVLASLDEAADFLRSLPIAEHAEPLIDVMEAADEPEMERRAWQAFETFAVAMQIPVRLGARREVGAAAKASARHIPATKHDA